MLQSLELMTYAFEVYQNPAGNTGQTLDLRSASSIQTKYSPQLAGMRSRMKTLC